MQDVSCTTHPAGYSFGGTLHFALEFNIALIFLLGVVAFWIDYDDALDSQRKQAADGELSRHRSDEL